MKHKTQKHYPTRHKAVSRYKHKRKKRKKKKKHRR